MAATPKEYSKNVNKGIITQDILSECLYSVNKRAKNCRDKEKLYRDLGRNNRNFYDVYNYEEKYRDKKTEYYNKKDILLSVLNPLSIHREVIPVYYPATRRYGYNEDNDDYDNYEDDEIENEEDEQDAVLSGNELP